MSLSTIQSTSSGSGTNTFSSNDLYIVTGAGRGIGQSIVQHLAARGARVLALDLDFPSNNDVDKQSIATTTTASSSNSRLIEQQVCDVGCEASVMSVFESCLKKYKDDQDNGASSMITLKGLVNCAGVVLEKSLVETTVKDFDHILGVNLRGTFLCTKAAVLHIQEQQQAATPSAPSQQPRFKIVNIASELAHLGRANYSAYCATKGGIISLTRSWARELAPQGILVNAVAPGPTDTPMLQSESNYAAWKDTAEDIPVGRIGQPRDIASVVCFLLSPNEANFMTGSVVDVNGGAAMY